MSARSHRLESHPILSVPRERRLPFRFGTRELEARPGEVISSALFAHGIHLFGRHANDRAPQGIFCANGQCGQCLVIADGRPVKACMVQVRPGMVIEAVEGRGSLPMDARPLEPGPLPDTRRVGALVLGGGPAGLCAAIELGRLGVDTLVVDDKDALGGKLTLQTHPFFGSRIDCWAGTRGIDIARLLAAQVSELPMVETWVEATAVGVFVDQRIGIVRQGRYDLVEPDVLLVATGARERTIAFPGSDLPGVYGAGAFQTLVNRDLIRPTDRLFVIGGGNVGLIAAYHALQAGIDAVGLVEALPQVGGYKVHLDKLRRLGVPVWTSHTVVAAEGSDHVERVVIAALDDRMQPRPETARRLEVDTVLVAVGLAPVNEVLEKARAYGLRVIAAGDAEEIAEASAAIFGGKIAGRRAAAMLGIDVSIPPEWEERAKILRSRPGAVAEPKTQKPEGLEVYPVVRCVQEIPCNPCTEACPLGSISIKDGTITGLPTFEGRCLGCGRCVLTCPALAIVLVDEQYDPSQKLALVTLPWELAASTLPPGTAVETMGWEGEPVGAGRVVATRARDDQDRRLLVALEVPFADRLRVAGVRHRSAREADPATLPCDPDPIVCRCERVRRSEVVAELRAGVRDLNTLKATLRTSMGPCGGKVCTDAILRICREESIPLSELTLPTLRPFTAEFPLSVYARDAGGTEGEGR